MSRAMLNASPRRPSRIFDTHSDMSMSSSATSAMVGITGSVKARSPMEPSVENPHPHHFPLLLPHRARFFFFWRWMGLRAYRLTRPRWDGQHHLQGGPAILQHLHALSVPTSSDSNFVHVRLTVLLCEAPLGVLSSAFPYAATRVSVCETPNRGKQTRYRYIYSYHFWFRRGHCGPTAGHLHISTQLPTLLRWRFGYDELGGLPLQIQQLNAVKQVLGPTSSATS